jgi:ABC-type uncharacterized transport system auxiliary subunit
VSGIVLVLLVLGACSTGAPIPENRFYELNPEIPAVSSAVYLKGGLSVAHISADPLRSGRAILYRDSRRPLELGRYHYELWAEQPPKMIRHALLYSLRQSSIADRVESEGRRPHFRYELDVKVRRFESLIDADRTRADVEIEADLRLASSGDLIWTKVYRQQVDARPGDMHALAEAMQQGLGKIFGQLTGDLKAAGTNGN